MIISENRLPLFGIMRCRHAPGGSDSTDNRKVIKQEPDTVDGAIVPICGGRLPFPPAIFAHLMVSAGLTNGAQGVPEAWQFFARIARRCVTNETTGPRRAALARWWRSS